uniref:Uncharacterized protein n=1 Tax=Anguilla anguilla TaxID=7936 RepID=A0A0E9W7Y9_ANGAN
MHFKQQLHLPASAIPGYYIAVLASPLLLSLFPFFLPLHFSLHVSYLPRALLSLSVSANCRTH